MGRKMHGCFNKEGLLKEPFSGKKLFFKDEFEAATAEAANTFMLNNTDNAILHKERYNILKRSIYQIGMKIVGTGGRKAFLSKTNKEYQKTVDDKVGRAIPTNAPTVEENPFYYVLYLAMGSRSYMPRQERIKAGDQLSYAAKHNVPPEYLIGFLHQCGSYSKLKSKLLSGGAESWYTWRSKQDGQF